MKKVKFILACLVVMLSFAQSLQAQTSSAKLTISSAVAKTSSGTEWGYHSDYTTNYTLSKAYDGYANTKYWSNGGQSVGNYLQFELNLHLKFQAF